jgi:hypothetical protein
MPEENSGEKIGFFKRKFYFAILIFTNFKFNWFAFTRLRKRKFLLKMQKKHP